MSQLSSDCPRCGVKKTTFDIVGSVPISKNNNYLDSYEVFCFCRNCKTSTIFKVVTNSSENGIHIRKYPMTNSAISLNNYVNIIGYVNLTDENHILPPDYIPEDIKNAFIEGAKCFCIGCYNASSSMLRLCLDLSTKKMLPENDENGLNNKIRRSLGLRMQWLIKNSKLPESLEDLATCLKDYGNDGTHEGTLSQSDIEDLIEFTIIFLERIYTEPKKIEIAKIKREERKNTLNS